MNSSVIYILKVYGKNNQTLVKLGYTDNLKQRMAPYVSANPLVEIILQKEVKNAEAFEKSFHNRYIAARGFEWYEESMLEVMFHELEEFERTGVTTHDKSFKETVLYYKNLTESYIVFKQEDLNRYPFLEEAVTHIGFEGMKDLDYHAANIKKTTLNRVEYSKIEKIKPFFKDLSKMEVNKFYTFEETKEIIKTTFKSFGIPTKPNASLISNFFDVQKTSRLVEGKKKDGFYILK